MTAPATVRPRHEQENTVHRENGRTLYSRADLQQVHGLSESTLQNLWTNRADNAHPDAVIVDGVMHWYDDEWTPWYRELQRRRAAAATKNAPNLAGDPEEEVGPAEAARICGFADTTTVSHYVKSPPAGWPEPDSYDLLPSGRRRPKWKRWKLWRYVAERKGRGHAGGRPKGRRGLAYPYQGDERLALARRLLAANPGATNAELIPRLQEMSEKSYSRPTWNLILKTAREHPED
ncbi:MULTISPECIES: hypothetical protein [Streptomyces]|uniref:hypothetical protein n=1 Tax=Streptomyces TaxID=1883 RepID=UPI000F74306D|nr:hypothetical protein [Streptomyces sp. WAC00469]RSS07559.1 hypothetical protein EF917_04275 [Streptomyces sp. WAC00469]